jgi:thioredoxin reductase
VTNIKGIFAVGDANTDNSTNVPHAMWSGKRAAVTIHGELMDGWMMMMMMIIYI